MSELLKRDLVKRVAKAMDREGASCGWWDGDWEPDAGYRDGWCEKAARVLAALGLDDLDAAIERACRAWDADWFDGADHTPEGEATWDQVALILKAALTATNSEGGK